MALDTVSLLVDEYDSAISVFVEALDFTLDDEESTSNASGESKRRVVVRPRDGGTGLLLSRVTSDHTRQRVGSQFAGKVGFILRVDDFEEAFARMSRYGVQFVESPRDEAYGRVVVFVDVAGNQWDLIGPAG